MDENEKVEAEETEETEEESEETEEATEDTKAEPKAKAKETPEARKARLERELKQLNKKHGFKDKEEPPAKRNSGELDETQLDYLDLKGISEDEDIEVIQKIVSKTGMTVRQALKDDYVVAKLDANRAQRAVKDATPGNQKRGNGGGSGTDLAAAIAAYDSKGVLPEDFKLASEVVNAITSRNSSSRPPWQK